MYTHDVPTRHFQSLSDGVQTCVWSESRSAANIRAADDSEPSLQSETQMDDALGQTRSSQQKSRSAANIRAADDSEPSLQSETQMDDALGQTRSSQQVVSQCQNESEIFVPRLRRTKSIIMKDTNLEDSDELFESTPESSDDYVPDTTSESDDDVSLTLNQTKHQYLEELDVDESDSVSFLDCDTTTSDKIDSVTSKASETEEEPSSSQNTVDSVIVSAYQKRDGAGVYNKRHYCLYCTKPYAKMARHLESTHADISDVARALSFPKGSKERKKELDYIRNRGNYAHNATVMESGKGELVPFKRPRKKVRGELFMHCAYCQGLFTRKVLWRHMSTCRLQPQSVAPKPGKNHVQIHVYLHGACAFKT
ncbi:hypothetical protein QQF64_018425 [Cirrhinus molitorella]|uniref:C2H2-type domain-containing protein n=1 Tax=Cirrhinus molitorella TaxID=172907 RepID=A0ABR3LG09_9TELE